MRQTMSISAGCGGRNASDDQPAGEYHKPHAAQKPRRITLRQPARDGSGDADTDRPGRDQEADLHRRIAEAVLQIERQCHESQHLGAEGRNRSADRQAEDGNAQQIDRQERRCGRRFRAGPGRRRRWPPPETRIQKNKAPRHGRRCRSRRCPGRRRRRSRPRPANRRNAARAGVCGKARRPISTARRCRREY